MKDTDKITRSLLMEAGFTESNTGNEMFYALVKQDYNFAIVEKNGNFFHHKLSSGGGVEIDKMEDVSKLKEIFLRETGKEFIL